MINSCCLASPTCTFLCGLRNPSNCWVCGAMPLSVMDGLPWWVLPLHQEEFKSLCSFLGRPKETFLSLVDHNLSLLSWCKPDLQLIDSGHGITYYVNTSFTEVTKAVIQNRMVLDILTAVQGGTCAIIKVECCVYIPDFIRQCISCFR